MITVNLNDPKLKENLEALKYARESGMFTDEELQKMYDRQIKKDQEEIETLEDIQARDEVVSV